jgi:hypothetical protein
MAVADMNGDGRDDLVRLHVTRTLSIEYQAAPGAPFTSFAIGNLPQQSNWAICVADVDRNGFNDIFAGPSGGGIVLLKADGAGSSYSLETLPERDIFVQGSVFADFDNDGNVDIFACDDNENNQVYRNDGAGGFTLDASLINTLLPAGVASGNYAAIWTDYNNDGHNDLYLSKCQHGVTSASDPRRINRLFRNNGNNSYADVGPAAGLADGAQTWCSDFADIDNDGDLDCFILNHGTGSSKLMENNGAGTFTNITAGSGLNGIAYYGLQALFRDFDNDTFMDLLVCASNLEGEDATYRLYRNNGNQTFTSIPNVLSVKNGGPISYLHSCALGDLNHDGFVDIYGGRGTSFNSPSPTLRDLLFLNDGNANHFLAVQLKGRMSNSNGIGARLELHGSWGVQVREVRAGEGYGIQNSLTKIFGLGSTTAITKLVVRWPSGVTEEILAPTADQFLQLVEGDALPPGAFTTPVVVSSLTATAEVGTPLAFRVSADNLALSYSIQNGPAGMTIDSESGVLSWTPTTEGVVTVEVSATNPAGTDTETLSITVELSPPAPDFASAINNRELVFSTSEDSPWFTQTAESRTDGEALQSGSIGNNERSFVETVVTGPGHLEFWWRVSSETDYDFLSFLVDGGKIEEISGDGNWLMVSYSVRAGSHTLTWVYEKDGSLDEQDDAGYLDEISYEATDSDGDGLRDDWEVSNFGDLSQSGEQDPDGDRRTNLEEQAAGTDPNDVTSLLRILSVTSPPSGATEVVFQSVPGKRYVIEGAAQLEGFVAVTAAITADGATTSHQVVLLAPGTETPVTLSPADAIGKALVPGSDLGTLWRGGDEVAFETGGGDDTWTEGPLGIGYDQNTSVYDPFIGTDLQAEMYEMHPTAYLRIPFTVDQPARLTSLTLRLRYDDGYAGWLNGTPIASDNAPGSPTWESRATGTRSDQLAVDFADIDLTAHLGSLLPGANILAMQGLNRTSTNRDFLLQPELIGMESDIIESEEYYFRVRVVD